MGERSALLFDFGGTLDADGVPWGPRFYAAYRAAGGRLHVSRFEPYFRESDRLLLGAVKGLGFRALVEQQVAFLGMLLPRADRVDMAEITALFHRESVATVRRNLPMLDRLSRSFTLGVVSNFSGNLAECLAELGLAPLFAVAIDSTVVGVTKPDHAIFSRALSAVGVEAEQTWFVGDNPERDVRPASELGMSTCWVAPADRPDHPGLTPTRRVASLLELERAVSS